MNYQIMSMKSLAKNLNDITFSDYYYRLMLMAKSMFKWEGLPNGIDEKWIEKYLFSEGSCMFYKDKTKGFMVTKCTHEEVNYYDEPIKLRPYGTNLVSSESLINGEECVLIRNNDDCIPTSLTIKLYAMRLAEIERTIDVNINMQKTPFIIKCSNGQKISLKQVILQRNDNELVIYGDKNLDTDNIDVLKTDAPIVFDKLQIQKKQIWNEVMTFLGVNNANMDKRERLVDDEVQANNEQIELCANVMLKSRERACELINELFNTNISVKLRTPKKGYSEDLEGGVNNAK